MFQTLRRSCETHLISLGHPHHVVANWLGHSVQVSKDHYLMVTSEDFAKATRLSSIARRAWVVIKGPGTDTNIDVKSVNQWIGCWNNDSRFRTYVGFAFLTSLDRILLLGIGNGTQPQ